MRQFAARCRRCSARLTPRFCVSSMALSSSPDSPADRRRRARRQLPRIQYGGDAARHHQRVVAAHRQWAGQSTFGRGVKNLSRLSVAAQSAPAAASRLRRPSPPAGALAFGKGADFAVLHLQRTASTSFSSTSLTLLIIMKRLPLVQAVGDVITYSFVMEDAYDGAPRVLASRISSTTAALFLASARR